MLQPPAHIKLLKMGPQDDSEAFMGLFEHVTKASSWLTLQWGSLPIAVSVGGSPAHSLQPPGVAGPEVSHIAVGWPHPVTTLPVLLCIGLQGG